ncbi:hypothetical protein PsorP6_012211 [Peronosclerospora sorghi]|uniref:Uncharacterized protein n=1 Tax=Peronosclerospora sorghi TaxID=230839 RepID=A0ACC0WKC6_9STRA|nr:hypothetical protein PsorP6_012211 [Peronosclerospora sorghi]
MFHVCDLVLLSTENMSLKHKTANGSIIANKKLIPKWIVEEILSDNVVKLKLPAHMDLHATFNVEKLKPYVGNPDQFEASYVIEGLRAKRVRRARTEYLVKWHGYDNEENTWEPETQIRHVEHWKEMTQELNAKSQQ